MSSTEPTIVCAGDVFERDHPFTWTTERGSAPDDVHERWRPGAWNMDSVGEDVLPSCTALGLVKFKVISTHRPPGYQERVFFTREFITPDGNKYVPARLMNCIARKFRRDVAAFPFLFDVEQPDYRDQFEWPAGHPFAARAALLKARGE